MASSHICEDFKLAIEQTHKLIFCTFVHYLLLTPVRLEHVDDAVSCTVQEDAPVEAKHHDAQQDGHYHLVDRFDGGHAPDDGQACSQDGKSMEEDWPRGVLRGGGGGGR